MILICISLMIIDVEHLFMCWLAICVSSLKKICFNLKEVSKITPKTRNKLLIDGR